MRQAFTLIEVLVVAAVVGLLGAILLPSLSAARAEARRAVCASNLHELGIASSIYLDQNRDRFWREYDEVFRDGKYLGRAWWFGFEPGGPPADTVNTRNRKLDKTKGPLAKVLRSTDDGLQCPAFPYNDRAYFPKFAGHSASYGYNSKLGPRSTALPVRRRDQYARRASTVFSFADAALYDFYPDRRINEGYYISYVPNANTAAGYAHFRHRGQALVLFLDGHVDPQWLRGPAYLAGVISGGRSGNLSDPAGGPRIYGY